MPEYKIQLHTSDGQSLSFNGSDEEDLVGSAAKENIYLNAQCKAGSCGACVAHCDEGSIALDQYSNDALSDEDRATGHVLLCCTTPKSDLKLSLPYRYSAIRFEETPIREAEIVAKTYLTKDTVKLDLQLLPDEDENLSLDFEPGQFMEITVPDEPLEKRAYSLANAPNWDGSLEFIIKLRENGKFSTFLDKTAEVGMKLTLEGASGTFMLHDTGLLPRFFVAGGCGLASIISMLRRMAEWQEPQPCKLFFGVWQEDEVFFKEEIENLAAEYPNLDYQICVTNASDDWQGYKGSAVQAFEAALKASLEKPDVYVCGSPSLIDGIAAVAEPLGIDKSDLIYERFLPSSLSSNMPKRCEIL